MCEQKALRLQAARASLEEVARRNRVTCDRLDVLDRRKTALQERLATATAEKASFEEACATRAAQVRRAQCLVASLYVEGGRWTATRRKLKRERRQDLAEIELSFRRIAGRIRDGWAFAGPLEEVAAVAVVTAQRDRLLQAARCRCGGSRGVRRIRWTSLCHQSCRSAERRVAARHLPTCCHHRGSWYPGQPPSTRCIGNASYDCAVGGQYPEWPNQANCLALRGPHRLPLA